MLTVEYDPPDEVQYVVKVTWFRPWIYADEAVKLDRHEVPSRITNIGQLEGLGQGDHWLLGRDSALVEFSDGAFAVSQHPDALRAYLNRVGQR